LPSSNPVLRSEIVPEIISSSSCRILNN
jgi:hypothetical protein